MNYENLYKQSNPWSARIDQGYDQLKADYEQITADALATRERNMGRIEQYGNSARQDMDIANKYNLAKSAQSAIMRGLGNTTIQDSMVRGQTFDNTRQKLALEDQLLQNRISSDTSLSNMYQGVLKDRAQGLANQWNTNMNLYTQQLQMQNANEQAALARAASAPQVNPWQMAGYRRREGLRFG